MNEDRKVVVSGHKDSILDLKFSLTSPWIVTTSDDHTIRLWNLEVSNNALKCFRGFGDQQQSVNSISFHPKYDHLLIGATDLSILQFDINSPGILVQEYQTLYVHQTQTETSSSSSTTTTTTTTSEITCFTIHPKVCNLLTIGDDNGVITIYNIDTQTIIKRLSRIHSNLLGKISYNPKNPNILVSGGFDCLCCAWDIRRGRPASNILNFTTLNQSDASNLQIANPPFVHDLLHILNGRILVCALGDGNIALYKSSDGSLLPVSQMIEAHGGMVTNLSHYVFSQNTTNITTEDREYFITSGADNLIKLWEVHAATLDPSLEESDLEAKEGNMENNQKKKKQTNNKKKKTTKDSGMKSQKEWYNVILKRAITHPNKINSISSMVIEGSDALFLAVGDVTSEWSLYTLTHDVV